MKKNWLLLVVFSLVSFAGHAQMYFMPKAGLSFSNIVFENNSDDKVVKTGLVAGAGFNLPVIDDFFSIQPELLFIQKGQAFNGDGVDIKFRETLNYIELPLLAKLSFGGETVKAYVNAGPSIGFGLGGKYKYSGNDADELFGIISELEGDVSFGDNANDEYDNRFDLGAQFGGGIGFQIGPGALLLDLRYGFSFSNLYKTENGMDKEDAKSKHRLIAITLGYAIPLGNK